MNSRMVRDRDGSGSEAGVNRGWTRLIIAGTVTAFGLVALAACSTGSDVSFHDDCDRQAYEATRTNYLEAVNRDFDGEYQAIHRTCHTLSS